MSTRPEDLRIGDAERDAAATALGEHFALGRLDREEYDDRADRVWAARTRRDLRPIFADLPAPHGADPRERTRAQPAHPGGRRAAWRAVPMPPVPLLPLLVLLVVLIVALPGPPWPLLILGWLWCAGVFRRGRRWHGSTHW